MTAKFEEEYIIVLAISESSRRLGLVACLEGQK